MLKLAIEITGWAAAAMMLLAYVLLNTGRLSSHGLYGVFRTARSHPAASST
jgi:hypothetical protein